MKITEKRLRALIRETIMREKLEVIAGTLTVKIMPATGATAELDGEPIETEEKVFVTTGPHTVTLKQGGKTATFEFTPTPDKGHKLVWDFTTNSHPDFPGAEEYNKDFTKVD